jgi:hypothetical protein
MKKVIGITLLAGGVVLLVFGFQSKGSFESKLSEAFQGSPNNRTTWYLGGGTVCAACGVALLFVKLK